MFAQVHHPKALNHQELESYLEQGWFRMGQTIFTTNFLSFNDHLYSAIWLRVALHDFKPTKTQKKLAKQNALFRVEIQKASITLEKEKLFEHYKQGVSFEASSSLSNLLQGKVTHNIYNTYEIDIYDGDTLIAVGYFDMATSSAAGISSFYNHAYRKYSLGNYLMFLKMEYCKKAGLEYFYPGYFVPGYSFFDYKLKINNATLQYLELSSQQWLPISDFSTHLAPVHVMRDRLQSLQLQFIEAKIDSKILKYVFYDANLFPDFIDAALFDFPLFLYCFETADDQIHPIIVYDVVDQKYRLINCRQVWKSNLPGNVNETYSAYLLKIEEDLFSAENCEEMVEVFLAMAQRSFITIKRDSDT